MRRSVSSSLMFLLLTGRLLCTHVPSLNLASFQESTELVKQSVEVTPPVSAVSFPPASKTGEIRLVPSRGCGAVTQSWLNANRALRGSGLYHAAFCGSACASAINSEIGPMCSRFAVRFLAHFRSGLLTL